MSYGDWIGWKTFFALEPWGTAEEDRRSAILPRILSNIFRDKKTKDEPFVDEDFIPKRTLMKTDSESQAPVVVPVTEHKSTKILQVVEAMNIALKGQDKRRQRPRYSNG